jgi:hypothetical protein
MKFGEMHEIPCFMKYHCVNYAKLPFALGQVCLTCLYSRWIPQAQNAVINCLVLYRVTEEVRTCSIPQVFHFPKLVAE